MRNRRARLNILFTLARTSPSSTVWVDHVRTFITLFNPPPGKLSNNIRFLAWQAVYFNELLNDCIINATVRFHRQRARKAVRRGWCHRRGKRPRQGRQLCSMDIEYFELRVDYAIFMTDDDTTRLRSAAICTKRIHISLSLETPSENACHRSSHKKLFAF